MPVINIIRILTMLVLSFTLAWNGVPAILPLPVSEPVGEVS